jgi:hypothetical protein
LNKVSVFEVLEVMGCERRKIALEKWLSMAPKKGR